MNSTSFRLPSPLIIYLASYSQNLMSDTTTNQEEMKKSTNSTSFLKVENPALWFVHLTAVTVQIIFGIGSCIGKEGLKNMPALIFAFYRELFASLILIVICVI